MGIFDKFKDGLSKTRALFSSQFQSLKLQMGYFDESQLEDLEYNLIRSDMGASNVEEIIGDLKKAISQSKRADADFVKDQLAAQFLRILGPKQEIELAKEQLNIFLMIGVNGAGKTTSCGKLAYQFTQAGKKVLICAADTFRAAAIEQLEAWAKAANCRFISQKEGSDPAAVVFDAVQSAKSRPIDLLIVDTAGRLQNKKNLMLELEKINRVIKREASEAKIFNFLVIDAANGQNALSQAKSFSESCPIDGFILTKLDGSAKGGVAIAIRKLAIAPIVYAGVGESITDLINFDPAAFVAALLSDTKQATIPDKLHKTATYNESQLELGETQSAPTPVVSELKKLVDSAKEPNNQPIIDTAISSTNNVNSETNGEAKLVKLDEKSSNTLLADASSKENLENYVATNNLTKQTNPNSDFVDKDEVSNKQTFASNSQPVTEYPNIDKQMLNASEVALKDEATMKLVNNSLKPNNTQSKATKTSQTSENKGKEKFNWFKRLFKDD